MELSLVINQKRGQLEQVAQQLGLQPEGDQLHLPEQIGQGFLKKLSYPGELNLYHYKFDLHQSLKFRSSIPKDADTFLVHINLSGKVTVVDDKTREASQKQLPKGAFFYSPGVEATGKNPKGVPFELVVLTFPRRYLAHYLRGQVDGDGFTQFLTNSPKFCVFEDLNPGMIGLLKAAIADDVPGATAQLEGHIQILQFMLELFRKVGRRREGSAALHPDDMQKLFMISGILKDHLHGNPPSIDALAREAGMSASKLKRGFKQVFGIPPYQYYLKAKMREARSLLQSRHFAISEVGHMLGYSNLSKFSQAFKKEFGMTPRQFRGTLGS